MVNLIKTLQGEYGHVMNSERNKGALKLRIKIINDEGEEEIRVVNPTDIIYLYPPKKET